MDVDGIWNRRQHYFMTMSSLKQVLPTLPGICYLQTIAAWSYSVLTTMKALSTWTSQPSKESSYVNEWKKGAKGARKCYKYIRFRLFQTQEKQVPKSQARTASKFAPHQHHITKIEQ
jgi:hypothetical protein